MIINFHAPQMARLIRIFRAALLQNILRLNTKHPQGQNIAVFFEKQGLKKMKNLRPVKILRKASAVKICSVTRNVKT